MRTLVLILISALPLAACAATAGGPGAATRAAGGAGESPRQKAGQAAQAGETSSEALAHVADGPKSEVAAPH